MNRISYSQFSMYSQCPYRWKLNYIDKLGTYTSNIYLIFGIAMHEVLQTYLTTMYAETVKSANELNLYELLHTNMEREFLKCRDNEGYDPCTLEEIKEFYNDGLQIINYFKSHRGEHFSKKNGWELLGCEFPINLNLGKNLTWVGYLDVVMYHKPSNIIKIIDIKTATMGWNKWQKKDTTKTSQLLLYKKFYSEQYNHPIERIEIEYFIVKRKLYENMDFPQKRIQKFIPASGVPSINKVGKLLTEFIDNSFNDDGSYKDVDYKKISSPKNCKYCEFKDSPEICNRNG